MKTHSLFVGLLFGAGYASAHGFLSRISINGKTYTGSNPFGNNGASVIRKISSPDPNYGAANAALTCGPNAMAASQVADTNPGDTITFDWRGADDSHVRNLFFTSCTSSIAESSSVAAQYGPNVDIHGFLWINPMRPIRRHPGQVVQDPSGRKKGRERTMGTSGSL